MRKVSRTMNSIPRNSGIYKITCAANDKIYIGSSNNLRQRWNEHRSDLTRNVHKNAHLQNAWNKYGEQSFVFEIVEFVMPWILLDREQFWLDNLKPYHKKIGFNIATSASNPALGLKHSPEHIEKIRTASQGRIHSAETRTKISAVHKGKVNSTETRAKISVALKGRKQSPELIEKRIAPLRGRTLSDEHKRKIGLVHKGKIRSAETCAKISAARKGQIPSAEAIAKSANSRRGLKQSNETKEKRAEKQRQKYIITNPDGYEFHIKGLAKFCRENNLDASHLCKVVQEKIEHYKGWKCRYDKG